MGQNDQMVKIRTTVLFLFKFSRALLSRVRLPHVQRSVEGCVAVLRQLYAAFDDLSRHLCISRWSLSWSYRGWTTVMRH